MTARDLTPTERAIRRLVAEHLPGMESHRITAYADKIHLATPLNQLGLSDGYFAAATISIERTYGFDLPDELWERCKCVADIVVLVEHYAQAEAAA